jgi:large subunit ribosomal protein L25
MAEVTLEVEKRESLGKRPTKKLRSMGKIPAVIYGHGEETVPLILNGKTFHAVLHSHHGENVIFEIQIPGQKPALKAILREVQHQPVTGEILHVDFQHISMTEKITVQVPVSLVGSPDGVRNKGGILEHILYELEIECLPSDIPEHIEVDVSQLDVGDSIHVSDISVAKVKVLTEPERSIATVVPPTVMKAPVEEEEVLEEEIIEEPELVEKERKEKEEEEGKEEAKEEKSEDKG